MIRYTVEFKSDAEIGSGLGGELVNSYVTRDSTGRPTIRGSHIKGVLRQTLLDITTSLVLEDRLVRETLGEGGVRTSVDSVAMGGAGSGVESPYFFGDASPIDGGRGRGTRTITRTAIDAETGTVRSATLRTTEAIAAGSRFTGEIRGGGAPWADEVLRLGLLSIGALGANRNRGAGRCIITIEQEQRSPGAILIALKQELQRQGLPPSRPIPRTAEKCLPPVSEDVAWFDAVFIADSPVLCPERPDVSNTLQSGFAIPASAVQGALLTLLDRISPGAASRCFEDSRFRAWPLLPCGSVTDQVASLPWPVRVSLTHRAAKYSTHASPAPVFADEAIEPYDWRSRPDGAPLKAQDGVLLTSPGCPVKLWRSATMPRVFTTHGVLNDPATLDGRNLYSIEAMAPLIWRGMFACPAELAESLKDSVAECDSVRFGKSRSVRGAGKLILHRLSQLDLHARFASPGRRAVLIAQSPIALPSGQATQTVQAELQQLAQDWAIEHGLGAVDVVWAAGGVLFGWNRHEGADAGGNARAAAKRVALPGAVIRLESSVESERLTRALLAGLGDGRQRGYGALSAHPGIAETLHESDPRLPELQSGSGIRVGVQQAYKLFQSDVRVLSSSQLSSVLERLSVGRHVALEYLEQQRQRGTMAWTKWQDCRDKLKDWIKADAAQAEVSLQVLRDLQAAQRRKTQ